MRDLLPESMLARKVVFSTVETIFKSFGFLPLETPAVERIETLTGKYGEEGGQLIFKILARGAAGEQGVCDLALRYDLTVPLSRVMAMNSSLNLPFKRYQMQPVWRADRPQKGRFREFYQCDVDVVGSESILAEAECLAVVHESLLALGFEDFTIRLNDRRLLRAMVEELDLVEKEAEILTSIDKLDKLGEEGARRELVEARGLDADAVDRLFLMLNGGEITGMEKVEEELAQITAYALELGVSEARLVVDRKLARGLDYYTGPVFETVLNDTNIGSVSGGGRYDGLIGMFSNRNIPAVGVSLGIERLLVIMEERGLLQNLEPEAQVWVTLFSEELIPTSLSVARQLRAAGISAALSLKSNKLSKQLKEANRRGIPNVVIIGPDDVAAGCVQWKELNSGAQQSLTVEELIRAINEEA
jgi:histidyl-tRNA synthetase